MLNCLRKLLFYRLVIMSISVLLLVVSICCIVLGIILPLIIGIWLIMLGITLFLLYAAIYVTKWKASLYRKNKSQTNMPQSRTSSQFCRFCGGPIPLNSTYCEHCGQKLGY